MSASTRAAAGAAKTALTGDVTLVVGPKTRLGAEVIAQARRNGESVVAIARGEVDEAALDGTGYDVRRAGVVAPALVGARSVRIVICALGPVHTRQTDVDRNVVARDLASVETLVAAAGPLAHLVYVSSVVALAPGADRRSYGGWKMLIEHELREMAGQHSADLSVVYPGRLVGPADGQSLLNRLHTRYFRLASLVVQVGWEKPVSKVVGLDARLWLLIRGFSVAASSVSGAGGTVQSSESEGHQARKQEFTS